MSATQGSRAYGPAPNGVMGNNQPIGHPETMTQLTVTVYQNSRSRTNIPTPTGEDTILTKVQDRMASRLSSLLPWVLDKNATEPIDILMLGMTDSIFQFSIVLPYPIHPASQIRREPHMIRYEREENVEIILDPWPFPKYAPPPIYALGAAPTRPIKLALFDMDSTLIDQEVIDELAATIGVSDAVSAITARAMNGEIDFATSLAERVGMLAGVKADVWESLKTERVTVARGARELVANLKERGAITGVISGGFAPMAEWLKEELGLDYAFANHLLTSPPTSEHPYPHLTGQLSPAHPIVTPEFKRDTLLSLSEKHMIPQSHTMAVGDGSNDLLMLGAAGLGVAWNAKERVQEQAPHRLNGGSLVELLWLLCGMPPASGGG